MPRSADAPHSPRHDDALDGLRGVAVLLIFLFHYGGGLRARSLPLRAFGYLCQGGWVGLPLFFALSGFLITGILLKTVQQPSTLPTFFARRALRILPLYWTALAIAGLVSLAYGAHWHQLRPLLRFAVFLRQSSAWLQAPHPLPLYHLWSLAVEEQFYLLWPFCMLLARTPRRIYWLCALVFLLSCTFRFFVFSGAWFPATETEHLAETLPAQASALAAGGALALVHRYRGSKDVQTAAWLTALVTAIIVGGGAVHAGSLLLQDAAGRILLLPAVHLLVTAAVALTVAPGRFRSVLQQRALVWLGRISYGFYVLHILLQPLFDALGTWSTDASSGYLYQAARMLFAFFLTLGAASLSYIYLERPFLRLKRFFPQPGSAPA